MTKILRRLLIDHGDHQKICHASYWQFHDFESRGLIPGLCRISTNPAGWSWPWSSRSQHQGATVKEHAVTEITFYHDHPLSITALCGWYQSILFWSTNDFPVVITWKCDDWESHWWLPNYNMPRQIRQWLSMIIYQISHNLAVKYSKLHRCSR